MKYTRIRGPKQKSRCKNKGRYGSLCIAIVVVKIQIPIIPQLI